MDRTVSVEKRDALIGSVSSMFALCLYYLIIPKHVKAPSDIRPGDLSPATFPKFIAISILVLSLLLVAFNVRRLLSKSVETRTKLLKGEEIRHVFMICFVLAAYYGLITLVGFLPASIVSLFLLDRAISLKKEGWLISLVFALGVPLLTAVIIEGVFSRRLPVGTLFEGSLINILR